MKKTVCIWTLLAFFHRRRISLWLMVIFFVDTLGPLPARADDFILPNPGVRVALSPAFNPPVLKGIKVHPENPFRFDFILDKGTDAEKLGTDTNFRFDSSNKKLVSVPNFSKDEALKQEAQRLIKYFLASLTVPEKDLWVNLSPYEKDRIVPQSFGLTEMGRDLLAQDYLLKQITASLIYPEDEFGKKFWKRVYEEAGKKFGTTNIPVNTFNKVWIVPEKAVVYENAQAGTAYVVESRLKVMLEEDYLAVEKNRSQSGDMLRKPEGIATCPQAPCQTNEGLNVKATQRNVHNALASQIVREIVIPQLTKEINENKNFAQLRQVYNSLILATWYKKKIKDSILNKVYADKNKVSGIGLGTDANSAVRPILGQELVSVPINVEHIYQQYLQAFKKGVYNYIKEEQDPLTQQIIPRKYFSGGCLFDMAMLQITTDQTILPRAAYDRAAIVETNFNPADRAMLNASQPNGNADAHGIAERVAGLRLIKEPPRQTDIPDWGRDDLDDQERWSDEEIFLLKQAVVSDSVPVELRLWSLNHLGSFEIGRERSNEVLLAITADLQEIALNEQLGVDFRSEVVNVLERFAAVNDVLRTLIERNSSMSKFALKGLVVMARTYKSARQISLLTTIQGTYLEDHKSSYDVLVALAPVLQSIVEDPQQSDQEFRLLALHGLNETDQKERLRQIVIQRDMPLEIRKKVIFMMADNKDFEGLRDVIRGEVGPDGSFMDKPSPGFLAALRTGNIKVIRVITKDRIRSWLRPDQRQAQGVRLFVQIRQIAGLKRIGIVLLEESAINAARSFMHELGLPREQMILLFSASMTKGRLEKEFEGYSIEEFEKFSDENTLLLRFDDGSQVGIDNFHKDRREPYYNVPYSPFKGAIRAKVNAREVGRMRAELNIGARPVLVVSPSRGGVEFSAIMKAYGQLYGHLSVQDRPLLIAGFIPHADAGSSFKYVGKGVPVRSDPKARFPDVSKESILILNTWGELKKMYALARKQGVAIVGNDRNILEPANEGAPVLSFDLDHVGGNNKDSVELMHKNNAVRQFDADTLQRTLQDSRLRKELIRNGKRTIKEYQARIGEKAVEAATVIGALIAVEMGSKDLQTADRAMINHDQKELKNLIARLEEKDSHASKVLAERLELTDENDTDALRNLKEDAQWFLDHEQRNGVYYSVKDSPKVSFVILHFSRSPEDTLRLLNNFAHQTYDNFDVVLVDNASMDDFSLHFNGYDIPPKLKGRITLVTNKANLGYSGGNNQAARVALHNGSDYVFFINNDALLEKDGLNKMIQAVKNSPEIGAVEPSLIIYDNQKQMDDVRNLEETGELSDAFKAVGKTETENAGTKFHSAINSIQPVPGHENLYYKGPTISGTAQLVRSDMLRLSGGFDTRLFAYSDERNLAYRYTMTGIKTAWLTNAFFVHSPFALFRRGQRNIVSQYLIWRNRMFNAQQFYHRGELGRKLCLGNHQFLEPDEGRSPFKAIRWRLMPEHSENEKIQNIKFVGIYKGITDGLLGHLVPTKEDEALDEKASIRAHREQFEDSRSVMQIFKTIFFEKNPNKTRRMLFVLQSYMDSLNFNKYLSLELQNRLLGVAENYIEQWKQLVKTNPDDLQGLVRIRESFLKEVNSVVGPPDGAMIKSSPAAVFEKLVHGEPLSELGIAESTLEKILTTLRQLNLLQPGRVYPVLVPEAKDHATEVLRILNELPASGGRRSRSSVNYRNEVILPQIQLALFPDKLNGTTTAVLNAVPVKVAPYKRRNQESFVLAPKFLKDGYKGGPLNVVEAVQEAIRQVIPQVSKEKTGHLETFDPERVIVEFVGSPTYIPRLDGQVNWQGVRDLDFYIYFPDEWLPYFSSRGETKITAGLLKTLEQTGHRILQQNQLPYVRTLGISVFPRSFVMKHNPLGSSHPYHPGRYYFNTDETMKDLVADVAKHAVEHRQQYYRYYLNLFHAAQEANRMIDDSNRHLFNNRSRPDKGNLTYYAMFSRRLMKRLYQLAKLRKDYKESAKLGKIINWLIKDENNRLNRVDIEKHLERASPIGDRDNAMSSTGGIDFKSDKVDGAFEVKKDPREKLGTRNEYMSPFFDPAMLEQLQNAPGFVPVIIRIQPMTDLKMFLGMKETSGNSGGLG